MASSLPLFIAFVAFVLSVGFIGKSNIMKTFFIGKAILLQLCGKQSIIQIPLPQEQ
jgi:hypothetical protein